MMRYKLLGKSGLRVSEICLGTMTFGTEWGWGAELEECYKIFETYVDAGGNFLDTANRYTEGTSEKIVGELIHNERDKYVLATKFSLTMRRGDINAAGNHRKNIRQAVEASLKRLNTDYIDLYWLHAWDFTTPIEEVMRTLDDLVCAGKVLYIGISDTPAWIISRANTLAELKGWTPFVALQVEYSLLQRTVERELLPMARALDIAVTPWAPLAGGVLTGKYNNIEPNTQPGRVQENSARRSERGLAIAAEVVRVANEIGCTPAQLAMNWVRSRPGIMVPIVGARNAQQLADSLSCLEVNVSDTALQQLDAASHIELGFPHDFLNADYVREILFSGEFHRLDNHHLHS